MSNVESLTAVNQFTGDQVTQYIYGTTLADSGIASSVLKRKEIYPDSVDDDDVILFEYNKQGEVTKITDQAGTVHQFDFDGLGRQTQDRVTSLGSGIDGTVRRIATTYEVRGMREKITSYDHATVGSGSVVNEVQFVYNDFGQLTHDYQSHSGTVNIGSTPKVQYGYADGSANTIRPTTVTYPDGCVITYDYGTSGSMADNLSRIAAIVDDDTGSTHLADYEYLGLGTFVVTDYTQPDIKYTLIGTASGNDPDTGDIYRGLDRFGRIKDSYWYDYGSSTDVDRIKYGYDRNGNRLWRENTVAESLGKKFDELYAYDNIDRLEAMDRGDLSTSKSQISNLQFAQDWSLDSTGNWRNFREDDDGNGTWDLDQQRTNNKVNEITNIAETTGPSWITPVYDPAGNMTTIPKPADPTQSYSATYDAWNRLVEIVEGSDTVAKYAYDGAKRCTIKKKYAGGTLDETRHLFYTEPSKWQVVEERVNSETAPNRQFIWGLRYIDDILLRDRDTTSDGTLDERLYGMQDANWNVTAITDEASTLKERYAYTANGVVDFMDGSFGDQTGSGCDWETTYAGYWRNMETDLYSVRNRVLLSLLGIWLQRDPLGGSAGPNLYQYSSSQPNSHTDPTGLLQLSANEFYVCGRTIRGRDAGAATARTCGCFHVDIWTTREGMIRLGFGGEVIQDAPSQIPLNKKGWRCTKLIRANYAIEVYDSLLAVIIYAIFTDMGHHDRIVGAGSGTGKKCKDATDAEIVDCVRNVPTPKGKSGAIRNCTTDVAWAISRCCLMGYGGLGLGVPASPTIPVVQ